MDRLMHRNLFQLLSLGALALTACKPEPEIQTYSVPKESSAPRPSMTAAADANPNMSPTTPTGPTGGADGGMTATPGMVAQVSGFKTPAWQAPNAWQAKAPGSVRKGSWDVPGENGSADMSITVFPGDVGGDLANVNRWRRELQLPPIQEAQLQSIMQHIDLPAGHAHLVFLEGPEGQSTHGAIVPQGNGTWFFKMKGDSEIVQQQKQTFLNFLNTVDFSAAQ